MKSILFSLVLIICASSMADSITGRAAVDLTIYEKIKSLYKLSLTPFDISNVARSTRANLRFTVCTMAHASGELMNFAGFNLESGQLKLQGEIIRQAVAADGFSYEIVEQKSHREIRQWNFKQTGQNVVFRIKMGKQNPAVYGYCEK